MQQQDSAPLDLPVRVIRSRRRRRTSAANVRDGAIEVRVPAHLAEPEVDAVVEKLVRRIRRKVVSAGPDEAGLMARAAALADRFVDGVRPTSITWSDRMRRRFASCTPAAGTIRVARAAATFPGYVLDALLVHELAHLVEGSHGPRFQAIVARNPDHARAEAWLDGYAWGREMPPMDGACGADEPSAR